MLGFVTAYLLSLFAAIFTGSCETPPLHAAVTTVQHANAQSGNVLAQLGRTRDSAEENSTPEQYESELAFEADDSFFTEVNFTAGEKYESSLFKFVFVQVLEQTIELPSFERTCNVKLPNQPTLVVLKVILQV